MPAEDMFVPSSSTAERKQFRQRAAARGVQPLWEMMADLVPPEPRPLCVPAVWRYEELRPLLIEAGKLLTAEEAERRVLALENPGLRGKALITDSLYAGIQLILPGEIAPTHRHKASALRFVIESDGAYTAVDGERTTMKPGDFILTPSWTFHDHGNPTETPTVWMDGLDVPIVNMLNTNFVERYPAGDIQRMTRSEGDALVRYGANLLPVDYDPSSLSAPVFKYPYARSREVLDQLYRNGPTHLCHGVKMEYVNPARGGSPMPTIAAFIQLLPAGFHGEAYRATDSTIYCVVEGRGQTQAGDAALDWAAHDVFVVPAWQPVSHRAVNESILFSFSDRPVQKALGLWREQAPVA